MGDDNGKTTERVILERRRVLVVPDSVSDQQIAEAVKDLVKGSRRVVTEFAWRVCDQRAGASKRASIEAHTGEPGTPDAKVGTFKAVPVGNWKGGLVLAAPAKPLVEAEVLDDFPEGL